jgi:hypothetical protein
MPRITTPKVFLGIDPGKSGAIAAVWEDGLMANSYARGSDTLQDQVEWLSQFDEEMERVAIIEKVHSSPQMGVVSSFTFGQSYGFLLGVLTVLKIPYHEVLPQRWQKAMGCMTGGDKKVSKHAAQKLWPHIKITHRDADARLIAEYGRLHIK